jgi:hypothetical protein
MSNVRKESLPPEPLQSLLATVRRAREIPEAPAYRPTTGDPLARLGRIMRGEEGDERSSGESAAPASVSGVKSSGGSGVEAALGREVLGLLRAQALPGPARAAAVELLIAELEAAETTPRADALRAVLAIPVTARHD